MKRLIPVLLVLFMFAGCSNSKKPGNTTVSTTVPQKLSCEYVQSSEIEQQTNGAVRQYSVSTSVSGVELLEEAVVLLDDLGRMTVLSGEECTAQASSSQKLTVLSVFEDRIIGYISDTRTVVVLNKQLQQVFSYVLEEGIIGVPVACAQSNEVYYCIDGYIRALNLDTSLTRHVMQYTQGSQKLVGCYFGGELIGWDNGSSTVFLSSKDGQIISQESALSNFQTGIDCYFGVYLDGFVEQIIWGYADAEAVQLELGENEAIYPQMQAECVITVESADNNKATLRRYDMTSGLCAGVVTADFSGTVLDVAADDTYTWILTDQGLYRWDSSQTPVSSEIVCTIPLINAENPDLEGLALCDQRAQEIGQTYGVEVHIWQDALLNDETYNIAGEYQVETVNAMLDALEAQLAEMPDPIFARTEEYCGIRICLVREIEGQSFTQFWAEGGLCIVLTLISDVEEALLTGLGWGIDSCVLGNSRDLDYWDELNPEDFSYDYSYFVNEQRSDLQYLEGEDRAFTDQRAMSFPSEDRARIFYYAMLEGNEEVFASPIMQQKLRIFCEGIREAYGWQKETQDFPWEQYLDESLAYTK